MLWDLITYESTVPGVGDITTNPMLLGGVILIVIAIFLPCLVWFIRNFLRIVMKINYEWLNRSLKWFALGGLGLFVVAIILLVIPLTGGA